MRWLLLGSFLLAFLVGCSEPPAQVQGRWKGMYNLTVSPSPLEIELTQAGSKLTGKYSAVDLGNKEGFEGQLEGSVNGAEVRFTLKVPQRVKERARWTDFEFKGVYKVEEGETILTGWTRRENNGAKDSMETLFSRPGAEDEDA